MKTFNNILSLLIAFAMLSSCETIIDYDLPREADKLTIDTKLLVGDTVAVIIGTSIYSLENSDPGLPKNASVKLYENNVEVATLKYRANSQSSFSPNSYTCDYRISENNTYKVEAALNGYPTAFGEQLVKESIPVETVAFDTNTRDLEFTFIDPASKDDFYLITIIERTQSYRYAYTTDDIAINFFDDQYFEDPFGESEKYGLNGYLSDQYFNGKTKTVRLNIPQFSTGYDDEKFRFQVELWRVSADLYEHERTKAISHTSDNPFSEPVQVYSNIENGYGIVGSAAVQRKLFFP